MESVLRGKPGARAMWLVAIAGQFVWLARALGSVDLADAVAIEGIVVAITFGILAVRVALRHEQELRTVSHDLGGVSQTLSSVSHRLTDVSDSVQTQPIGEFPEFLPHITAMMANAEKSITIMCDAPAYGIYSNGQEFDLYAAVLKSKIALRAQKPSFSVELMFLGDREREAVQRDATGRYARTADEWNAWRDAPETQERLRALVKRVGLICRPEVPPPSDSEITGRLTDYTLDDFIQDFYEVDEALLTHDYHGAIRRVLIIRDGDGQAQVSSRGPSIYFWMRDGVEAIFVVVPMGERVGESREIGFRTHDPSMIDALRGIFSRYQRAAVPFAARDRKSL